MVTYIIDVYGYNIAIDDSGIFNNYNLNETTSLFLNLSTEV
jgi:hypothetical protein